MIRANLGTERLGWEQPQDDMVLFPKGKGLGDIVPRMRSRLHDTPVLLPTWGWPPDENTVPPDDPEYDAEKTSRLNPAAPPDWQLAGDAAARRAGQRRSTEADPGAGDRRRPDRSRPRRQHDA